MYWHFKHHWPHITYTHVSQTQTIIHIMNLTDDALNGLNIQKSCACVIHTVAARTLLEYKMLHSTLTVQSGHSLHTGNINFNPLLPSSCLDVVREAKLRPSLGLAVEDFSFTDFFNPPPILEPFWNTSHLIMSGHGKGGKAKGKAKSRSSRAGLQFPVKETMLRLGCCEQNQTGLLSPLESFYHKK